jgi:hypothetical protein
LELGPGEVVPERNEVDEVIRMEMADEVGDDRTRVHGMSKSAEGSLTEIHHDRVISVTHEKSGPD